MVKLVSIESNNVDSAVATLYSDTKAEVPSTGTATVSAMTDFSGKLEAGSKIYTSALEIGILKSDDTWNWGD